MTDNAPHVSVIIPVYNGERYLADAIKSVLQQAYRPYEIIIVDDGSEDNTAEIARSYPQVQYIFQLNQGVATARNTGLAVATGCIVTFLDHDDLMLPNSLNLRITYLIRNPQIQCLIAMHTSFLERDAGEQNWVRPNEFDKAHFGFGYLMAKKSFFVKVGGFKSEYLLLENMELFFRAKEMGFQVAKLPEVVIRRRIHTSNTSRDIKTARMNLIKMTRASIHTHRNSRNMQNDE